MKRSITLTIWILVCVLLLTACGCGHANVQEGSCTTDKVCADCGEILEPAPGHSWAEATFDAPQTCTLCGATEGTKLSSEILFSAEAAASLLGKWSSPTSVPGQQLGSGVEAYVEELSCILYVEFSDKGEMTMYMAPADQEELARILFEYSLDSIYEDYAALDMTKEDADADILNTFGMTTEDYVHSCIELMDLSAIFSDYSVSYVYYVDGNQLYLGFDWFSPMAPGEFTLEGDSLFLPFEGGEPTTFTRVTE